jgi:SHS2 domain-containing protein
MAHRVLDHTADTGIEATAGSPGELLAELLTGMFGLVADIGHLVPERVIHVRVEATTMEDLVVDTLAELLFVADSEDLVLGGFDAELDRRALTATVTAKAVPAQRVDIDGPPLKGVTYHRLAVEEQDGGWCARVFFDV